MGLCCQITLAYLADGGLSRRCLGRGVRMQVRNPTSVLGALNLEMEEVEVRREVREK